MVTCQSCGVAIAGAEVHFAADGASVCASCAMKGSIAAHVGGQHSSEAELQRRFQRGRYLKHLFIGVPGFVIGLVMLYGAIRMAELGAASKGYWLVTIMILVASGGDAIYAIKGLAGLDPPGREPRS